MSLTPWFTDLLNQTDKIMLMGEQAVGKQYAGMLKEIRGVIREAYDQYALEDVGEDSTPHSEMAKYNRQDKLNKEVNEIVLKYTSGIAKDIRSTLRKTVTNSFDHSRVAVETIAERTVRGILKPETVTSILQNPISGLPLNERLGARRHDTLIQIREELTRGLIRGDRYQDISARLQRTLEIEAGKAYRIVRTESHRCMEAGKKESLDSAARQGITLVKWWKNSDDERVRPDHIFMGKKYSRENAIPWDEDFVNDRTGGVGPHPGALGTAEDDIHCRCVSIVEVVIKVADK